MIFDIVKQEDFSGPVANIYSIQMDGQDQTLINLFFEENEAEHSKELDAIASRLVAMGHVTGCKDYFFKAYQEDPELNKRAEQMKQIAAVINRKINEREIKITVDGDIDYENPIMI